MANEVLPVLKKRREFVQLTEQGRKFVAQGFVLLAMRRSQENRLHDVIRVGFTTTKKIGNAVERNRVRRRLRALARAVLPVCGKQGWDYVLIGRQRALELPFAKMLDSLTDAVKKV